MEDDDWDALASELVRQNYAFVTAFSAIVWDCLITFGQEVKYIWHCQSRVTKYLFLFCRYCAVGYFILYSTSSVQWTPQIPISRKDCRTWFLIHTAALGLLYTGSQVILIRKVFNLYGKSLRLASGLFALQCIQVTGVFLWSHHVSDSLNFNPICNSANFSRLAFSIIVTSLFVRLIIRALILRKVRKFRPGFFARWRRYLRTSDAHAKISWGACLSAIVLKTSHSFAYRRLAPIYVFTFPVALLSIGTCRYILRIERDRYIQKTLTEVVDIDDLNIRTVGDKSKQRVVDDHLPAIPHSYPADLPSPMSDPETLSIRTSQSQTGGHNFDTVSANFPYLYGAESYKLKRNRTSMATANTTDYSGSSLDVLSRPSSVGTPRGSSPRLNTGAAVDVDSAIANGWNQNNIVDETLSASDIEIGSLHSSSSVDSEELRQFYGDAWNVGPFMAAGP